MRKVRLPSFFPYCRRLILSSRDDGSGFSSGYIPLDGSERIESVYSLIKSGHFVAPLNKIETIHEVYVGVNQICRTEFPIFSSDDVLNFFVHQDEIMKRILIKRDFWVLQDFNDPELNRSYGLQNLFFDNYKWSQVLWKRFQQFVEEYYPLSEHTHLLYQDYLQLIKSFATFEKGVSIRSVLPNYVRLHPPYGISFPSRFSSEPLLLLKNWVDKFRKPLKINKALVVDCGCGVSVFALANSGILSVCGVDPRPRAVHQCRSDAKKYVKLHRTKFEVAELFPIRNERKKYDLVFFYPDEDLIQSLSTPAKNTYAPSLSGLSGKFEQFFDTVSEFLSDTGVIVICSTNLMSLLKPFQPHPIEFEVKVNRRFVILDYFDCPMKCWSRAKYSSFSVTLPSGVSQQARSELWVLHKISALHNFAHFHGIPGSGTSCAKMKWSGSPLSVSRLRSLRHQIESAGGDWGTYKSRLLTLLQERSDIEEDDVAESLHMALDITFPEKLAKEAQKRIGIKLKQEKEFNEHVASTFKDFSPRAVFDKSH